MRRVGRVGVMSGASTAPLPFISGAGSFLRPRPPRVPRRRFSGRARGLDLLAGRERLRRRRRRIGGCRGCLGCPVAARRACGRARRTAARLALGLLCDGFRRWKGFGLIARDVRTGLSPAAASLRGLPKNRTNLCSRCVLQDTAARGDLLCDIDECLRPAGSRALPRRLACPHRPALRVAGSKRSSPRNSRPRSSAASRAPPCPKISVRSWQCGHTK